MLCGERQPDVPCADGVTVKIGLAPPMIRHTGVGIEDYLVVNRQALAHALVRIVRRPEIASARHTVIHLSTHGSPDGLELTSGERLDWPQLAEALRYVNEAVSGRLLLCLSACHGLHALKMVAPQAELPFRTLVGPTDEVAWVDSDRKSVV